MKNFDNFVTNWGGMGGGGEGGRETNFALD